MADIDAWKTKAGQYAPLDALMIRHRYGGAFTPEQWSRFKFQEGYSQECEIELIKTKSIEFYEKLREEAVDEDRSNSKSTAHLLRRSDMCCSPRPSDWLKV